MKLFELHPVNQKKPEDTYIPWYVEKFWDFITSGIAILEWQMVSADIQRVRQAYIDTNSYILKLVYINELWEFIVTRYRPADWNESLKYYTWELIPLNGKTKEN